MEITYLNLPRTFLDSYDLCLRSAGADYCRNAVSQSATLATDAYLRSYEGCRGILGSGTCKDIFAPDPNAGIAILPIFAVGFIIGAAFFKKE